VLQVSEPVTMYQNLVSHWKHPHEVVINGREPRTALIDDSNWPRVPDFTHRMMHLDMETYLPGDILTKVDRASMGVSLEGRIPLLDPRVIEFAWRIPLSMKVMGGQGKWLLRQVLFKHVPRHLIERPKMGFSVPLGEWLRGELREWAEALLNESRLNGKPLDIHAATKRLNYNDCWLDFDVRDIMHKGSNALTVKVTARNSHVLAPLSVRHVDVLVRYKD